MSLGPLTVNALLGAAPTAIIGGVQGVITPPLNPIIKLDLNQNLTVGATPTAVIGSVQVR